MWKSLYLLCFLSILPHVWEKHIWTNFLILMNWSAHIHIYAEASPCAFMYDRLGSLSALFSSANKPASGWHYNTHLKTVIDAVSNSSLCAHVFVLGVEPVLVSASDPRGPCPLGVGAADGLSPAPSWWYEGLPAAEGTAIHSEHRRYPHLLGRVYTRYQTTWRAHGPQPAGTCGNHPWHTHRMRRSLTQNCTVTSRCLRLSRVVLQVTASSRWPQQSELFRPRSGSTNKWCPASVGPTAATWRCSPAAPRRWAWCWWEARSHTHIHTHTPGPGVGQGSARRHVSQDVSAAGSWGCFGTAG